ncbi:VOC family protein [Paenibacillus sepulcri]|uniref:VOC family protein n=1 Tax=Paenibacillus sepulcri TaxID=359917 RepID=A0ABS7CCM5_9BACL|nr:VOC family protein [Paenibacillus sepulcri]
MGNPLIGTNTVTQIGILVHDIEKTAAAYSKFLGIEPRFVTTGTYEEAQTEYLGKPSQARSRLCFFKVGPSLELELIQPDLEPSTWRNDLDQNGEGVHHIAFVVEGMKEKILVLERNNMPLLQKGEYTGGRYAYIDANEDLKVVLELLENDK